MKSTATTRWPCPSQIGRYPPAHDPAGVRTQVVDDPGHRHIPGDRGVHRALLPCTRSSPRPTSAGRPHTHLGASGDHRVAEVAPWTRTKSVYVDLILPTTEVAVVGDVRVSRILASPCGAEGLTVSHTDACGAGTCLIEFTPTRGAWAGRLRRTRRCRGLRGVGPTLSRHRRTGACSATRTAGNCPRRRVALLLPSNARLARLIPATWSRFPPTSQLEHHAK